MAQSPDPNSPDVSAEDVELGTDIDSLFGEREEHDAGYADAFDVEDDEQDDAPAAPAAAPAPVIPPQPWSSAPPAPGGPAAPATAPPADSPPAADDRGEQGKLSFKERMRIARESLGSGGGRPPAQPPVAQAGAGDEEEKPSGLIGKLRERFFFPERPDAVETDPDEEILPDFAGLDTSKPSLAERLRAFKRSREIQKVVAGSEAPSGEFEKLLRPLSGPELTLLQAEASAEVPMFEKFKTRKERTIRRQKISLFGGVALLIIFAIRVWTPYLTEVLPGQVVPDFIPSTLGGYPALEFARALLYGFGLLMPALMVPVCAEAIHSFWSGVDEARLEDIMVAAISTIATVGLWVSLTTGQIPAAMLIYIGWLLARGTVRAIGALWRRLRG